MDIELSPSSCIDRCKVRIKQCAKFQTQRNLLTLVPTSDETSWLRLLARDGIILTDKTGYVHCAVITSIRYEDGTIASVEQSFVLREGHLREWFKRRRGRNYLAWITNKGSKITILPVVNVEMKTSLLFLLFVGHSGVLSKEPFNLPHENRTLIVMVAPSLWDEHYRQDFHDIINFQLEFARIVHGEFIHNT